jgi:hypothetical protein
VYKQYRVLTVHLLLEERKMLGLLVKPHAYGFRRAKPWYQIGRFGRMPSSSYKLTVQGQYVFV